jgi:hypothetical protein
MRPVARARIGTQPVRCARRLDVERHMWLVRLDTIVCVLVVIVMLGLLLAQVLVGMPLGALLEAQRLASRGMADEPELHDVLAPVTPPRLHVVPRSPHRRFDP